MANIDRINYDGFSGEYVMQRFEIALDPRNAYLFNTIITSDEACDIIMTGQKGLSGLLVKLAFKCKGIIKRTPLANTAIKIKNKMLSENIREL